MDKIPLPSFLKLLTSNNITTPKAMVVAGKIYKEFNTPDMLSQLTDIKMKAAGIDDKDLRKSALAAFRKAGYAPSNRSTSKKEAISKGKGVPEAGPSVLSTVQIITTPTKKKRKRVDDTNEFLPDGPVDEAAKYGSMEFNEILDEDVLKTKYTIINRAPLMTAWATIVAERMGFQREEALSIASVYTEMNAISKGVSLGIFDTSKNNGMEASRNGSQPYVDIMGRRVPLYQTQSGKWQALSNNSPAQPGTAFSYISRAFRQTTSHIIGALQLLAKSYGPQELNEKGFGLYAEFRPDVEGWGGRGEVRCDKILALRREALPGEINRVEQSEASGSAEGQLKATNWNVKNANQTGSDEKDDLIEEEPDRKKSRGLTLEEYEAALDQDTTFQDVDLNFSEMGVS